MGWIADRQNTDKDVESLIKGKYVAQVEIAFTEDIHDISKDAFEELRDYMRNGGLSKELEGLIKELFMEDLHGAVTITQQFADLYMAEDENYE